MQYLVRDQDGNVYGPAEPQMLRDWVQQGRIIVGMSIAPENTREWLPAAEHPAIADLLQSPSSPERACLQGALSTDPVPSNQIAQVAYAPPTRQNLAATLSLIFGSVSIVSTCGFCIPVAACLFMPLSGLMALSAIVLGTIALRQIKQSPAQFHGKGLALAGISMGAGTLALALIGLILGVIIAAAFRP